MMFKTPVAVSAAGMRREFDEAFAAPIRNADENREQLILIQTAGEKFAVRMRDITGLAKLKRITMLPSPAPALLGITGVRGALYAAYDLAALLGLTSTGNERAWMLLANPEMPVGLVFDQLEGQIDIVGTRLNDRIEAASHKHIRQVAKVDSDYRAVIDVTALVHEIRIGAGLAESRKE